MSPIGRAFIVANLFLAGGFIFFAGSYLQHQNDYKSKLEAKTTELKTATTEFQATAEALRKDLAAKDGQNVAISGRAANQEAKLKELNLQIQSKEELLGQLSSSVSALEASASTMATRIENAADKADGAYNSAVDAQKSRDEALGQLSEAQRQIDNMRTEIAALTDSRDNTQMQLADTAKELNSAEILLAAARSQGFSITSLTPPMEGTVTDSAGALVTIAVAKNPSSADITKFRGSTVAIYDASGYKGDVTITDGNDSGERLYLFGRVFNPQPGKPIQNGDAATTNVQ